MATSLPNPGIGRTLTETARARKVGRGMATTNHERDAARVRLLAEIAAEALATEGWTGRAAFAPRVMAALAKVPRHLFTPLGDQALAYVNRPQPIGHGQTISQPYIVALMSDLLDLSPEDSVLEVGTGSGYQTAVLAEIARRVFSVEIIPELAERARQRLAHLGYANVEVRVGDGADGWPEKAPFAAIMVTAAPERVPRPLVEQLASGGRMVIPLGRVGGVQTLHRGLKDDAGRFVTRGLLPVAFVPLIRGPRAQALSPGPVR